MSIDLQALPDFSIRRAGVLLHPTSLPGPLLNGDFGHDAYRFVEFLHASGFSVWQMLPLGPTHPDQSPYQCLSAHAGNHSLISLSWLADKGWLDYKKIRFPESHQQYRKDALRVASITFYESIDTFWSAELEKFKQENSYWLDDFALFMAIKESHKNLPWYCWPNSLKNRTEPALQESRKTLSKIIDNIIFEQFIFFVQWHEIREYAHRHNVLIFGDIPIFVAHDSADIWAHQNLFLTDSSGDLTFVAGVPPDAFSDTGQRWGNPLYNWDAMENDGFAWWKDRLQTQLKLFDMIRIDHFRGLESFWRIPANEKTAINGEWVKSPGDKLLAEIFKYFDHLPIVAEDLGVITEEVIQLRKRYELPGMKILQFAFDGNPANPYLPHNHDQQSIVYTGTHDNDTTIGWWHALDESAKKYFLTYVNTSFIEDVDVLSIMQRLALSSVCPLAILPMQDILSLDSSCRMNIPGTIEGNWRWRFDWSQLKSNITDTYHSLLTTYERIH